MGETRKWIRNWFSNFEPFDEPLSYQGMLFSTSEHFFQAMKCRKEDVRGRQSIADAPSPSLAKKMGRKVSLRADWEQIKEEVMEHALRYKFQKGSSWHVKLMNEGSGEIVERNNWHDNIWGDCVCPRCKNIPGRNLLGKLLMKIRDEYS